MASSSSSSPPHIALFPSAGMGHLTPFLRLASMLSSRGCIITLITAKPTVSMAESDHISYFLSTHPKIKNIEFQIIKLPHQPDNNTSSDPFFLQFAAISRSVHLLRPLLSSSSSSSSPPISAVFCDLLVANGMSQIASELGIPYYLVFTTSAKFRCLLSRVPISNTDENSTEIEIPGMSPVPFSDIPPPFFDRNHIFTTNITSNAEAVEGAKGIIMNTFKWFEPETFTALDSVFTNSPPVIPIGPLQCYELENDRTNCLPWLNNQPDKSVVFVSFGSRTAMSVPQIRELGNGLERSGCRFLWVLKTEKVDKEDKQEVEDVLGKSFFEKTKNRGMIIKKWVNQQAILGHSAIGGFINHCGWNSVMEAADVGVPLLAWPQHGDQRVNAAVVEAAGLGIWERDWGWGSDRVINGEEISGKIVELMDEEKLQRSARNVGEEGRKAHENGGSSKMGIQGIIHDLSKVQT